MKKPVRKGKKVSAPRPARKRWNESAIRLLLNANPIPAFLTDLSDYSFVDVNEAALKKLGYTRSEFLRMKLTDIRPPEDVPRLLEYTKTKITGLTDAGLWRHKLKNGDVIDVHITANPVLIDDRKLMLSTAQDVSEARRVEAALKGAQEELSEIVSNAPIILFMTDLEGRFLLSQGKGLLALGLKPGEAVGRSIHDMYRNVPAVIANFRKALSGQAFKDSVEIDGLVFETHYAPHYDDHGAISGVIGVGTDVTERRRADVLLHQQAAAIKASMDGMAIHDHEGRFIYLNDAHARLYGYGRPEDLIGKTWKTLYTPEELRRFENEVMPRFWKEGQWRGEAQGRRQDGSVFSQEVSLTRIEGGGLVCVARDVTERKRAEGEHARLLTLEKEARFAAEATNRAKDEFLAVVSHELRTPMTAILGWTWLVRSGDVSAAERNRALEIIERNMKLQAQIIEDLLDLSSIVTGKLHLDIRPAELGSILQAAADTIRSACEAKGVTLTIECEHGLTIYGDHFRLQQVFWNLFSNAVKFNKDGGKAAVRARNEGGCAVISIEDEGAGIEPDFLPEMFELFRQGENSLTRQHRGLGVGLAIVRHLVEMHGGAVHAASPGPGRGTTFTITLPLSKMREEQRPAMPPALASAKPSRLAHTLDGLSIVVVDDEDDTLRMLAELLGHCGAKVTTSPSAKDALVLIEKLRPKVLIADIAMPVQDGYTLIRNVRALGPKRGGDVLALALTARARQEDRDLAMEAGFQMYLSKPVEPEDLVTTINNLVGQAKK